MIVANVTNVFDDDKFIYFKGLTSVEATRSGICADFGIN